MQPDETRQPATRDDVTHSIEAQVAQECLALGPRSELRRAVQVTFRADLDDARSPGRGELPRALGGHPLVVAADHDRSLERQPLEGHGHEAVGPGRVLRRLDVARRDEERALDLRQLGGRGFPCEMRDRGAAEAVRGQHHGPGRVAYGGPDAFDPVGPPGRLPVLLLDAAGVLALALPVRLPVVGATAPQPGDGQQGDHRAVDLTRAARPGRHHSVDVLASTARRPALASCSVCCSPEAPSKGSLFNVLASPSRDVQAEVRARGASAPDLPLSSDLAFSKCSAYHRCSVRDPAGRPLQALTTIIKVLAV